MKSQSAKTVNFKSKEAKERVFDGVLRISLAGVILVEYKSILWHVSSIFRKKNIEKNNTNVFLKKMFSYIGILVPSACLHIGHQDRVVDPSLSDDCGSDLYNMGSFISIKSLNFPRYQICSYPN